MVELDPVALEAKSSARRILSLMILPLFSTEEKIRVGDDGLPEKNGTCWSGRVVELDPFALEVESSSRRILSFMMLPSSAEEKT